MKLFKLQPSTSFMESVSREESENIRPPLETPADGEQAYPPKPVIEETRQGSQLPRFIISVILFAVVFYFYAGTHWQAIAWLIVIIFIHELGHYLAMKIFKYKDLTIFFIPLLGAVAGGSKEKISQREKSIVLLAGPVPGILIGLGIFFLASEQNNFFLLRLSYAFVLLNVLNLLPIYPLDGGQLLKTLFLHSRETVSFIFIVLSVGVATWFAISREQWFLLIVPYFLILRMWRQITIGRVRKHLDSHHINYYKNYSELTDEEYWKIRDEVAATNPMIAETVTPGEYVVTEKEPKMIEYIKSVLKTTPVVDLSLAGKILIAAIWIISFVLPFLVMYNAWAIF
jgi:stage IV sporulation protein FB